MEDPEQRWELMHQHTKHLRFMRRTFAVSYLGPIHLRWTLAKYIAGWAQIPKDED